MEFELQKLRIETGDSSINSHSRQIISTQIKSNIEFHRVKQRFISKKTDISLENQALIDTESSYCLLNISVVQRLQLEPDLAANVLYGFGNQKAPAMTSKGRIKADIEADDVKGQGISIYIFLGNAHPVDLIIGRTWLNLLQIAYARLGKRFHTEYLKDETFSNLVINEKINRICLKALKATKLEKKTVNLVSSKEEFIKNG
ncbi:retrovirus-related Pol polyprotein from transposon 17.6 [Nephila pilipes]|uniref:Retrovirus-related Pol polyprotein from transposon 17.6 n=1 Tax=Nephila pilipes TaxID=299642 RepID=A0A8X6TSZ3_NEPPI|nr:retrovirus-related Pol polyprotein from transposon 17.6 [Nephila pilipes]